MSEITLDRGNLVLISASLLCLALGSVHAFSVFLEPIEREFGVSRSQASLTYSIALVALTISVLTGENTFSRLSAGWLTAMVCLLAAAGTLVAASATTLPMVWFGYSILFGGANGLGYGFGLQIAAQSNPGFEGRSMGVVTASYALGAAVSPVLFEWAIAHGGLRTAWLGLSASLLLILPVCAALMSRAKAVFQFTPTALNRYAIFVVRRGFPRAPWLTDAPLIN